MFVGNSSGSTADIGPKVRPMSVMPVARNASISGTFSSAPTPMFSGESHRPNERPNSTMSTEITIRVGRRPKRSASRPETGTNAAKNRMPTSCSTRNSA